MRRWISLLSSVLSLLTAHLALGAQTTGGVNWLDPLAYQKPAFVSITEPDNPVATYYIDGTSGSGSTCSSGSPCKFFSDLCGKTGMTGGPVYVYIKGTIDTGGGNFFYNYTNCYGSPGSEILVRPWPGFTATIAGTGNNVMGGDSPSQTHDWIFDGGPSLGITIKTQNDNTKVGIRVNANNFTFYRVQGTCSNNAGGDIIVTTAAGVTNLKIINSEFYDCVDGTAGDQQGAVYLGSCVCNGTCGYSNFTFRNNIVRNFGGEGIELNPRVASSGAIISGSAFRHTGFQTCSGTWGCRPSILVDGPSCGFEVCC